MEKHVYIVVSQTGTLLSRFLKLVTRAEYNHASISLVPDLDIMYSFGRKNPYNPFLAGFVKESARFGTFKRFSKTRVVVLDIAVSDAQYQAISRRINTMTVLKHHYRYNYLGLWLAGLRICYRQKRCFYCSEFVKDLLEKQDIHGVDALDPIVQPIHFLSLPAAQQIYTGLLKDYRFVRPAFR
jgi:hypothetical protein